MIKNNKISNKSYFFYDDEINYMPKVMLRLMTLNLFFNFGFYFIMCQKLALNFKNHHYF